MRKLLLILFFYPCITISANINVQDAILQRISDKSIPFIDRYTLVIQHFDDFTNKQRIELVRLMKEMIPESKQFTDKTQTIHLYANLSLVYLIEYHEPEIAKHYIDSAMVYENQASELGRAKLYLNVGNYGAYTADIETQQKYLYKAISCYEKVGGFFDERISALCSIAISHYDEKDTVSMKNIIEKVKPLTKQANTFKSDVHTNIIIAIYYELLYNADKQQTRYLDSTLLYYSKMIQRYESYEDPPAIFTNTISNVYTEYAYQSLQTSHPDMEKAIKFAHKAVKLNPKGLEIRVIYHRVCTEYFLKKNQLDPALESALKALYMIKEDSIHYKDALKLEIYEVLSNIYEQRKEYEHALEYKKQSVDSKFKVYDKERHQTLHELQTRYEVSKKEEDIQRLTERNQYQERIRYLMFSILGLTILIAVLGFLWFRRKRRSDADALHIARLQQREAELKVEMETAKLEEKEVQYNALTSEMEKKQLQSYLEGLEGERSRLAKEMHDHVSNGLLALEIKMQSAGVSGDLTTAAHDLHSQVRDISHALMPPVFQYASLPEIIDEYVREQNKLDGPCFQFYLSPEEGWESLPHQTALDLYRIVQEACSNALKHAHAKNITISLTRKDDQIELSVTDDGQGMLSSDVSGGIGMRIINERVVNQKGKVVVDSNPGKGTAIKTFITLEC